MLQTEKNIAVTSKRAQLVWFWINAVWSAFLVWFALFYTQNPAVWEQAVWSVLIVFQLTATADRLVNYRLSSLYAYTRKIDAQVKATKTTEYPVTYTSNDPKDAP